jgi:hypothetical protein
MNPSDNRLVASDKLRLGMRLFLWVGIYLTVVHTWIAFNGWPIACAVSVSFLPVALVAARWFYRRHRFPPEPMEAVSHWELLVAFLVLAIGVASGLVLLMTVGWLSLGVLWLRPRRLVTGWAEWFKLPALFALAMPLSFDVVGGADDWLSWFTGSTTDLASMEPLVRFEIILRVSALVLLLGVPGRAGWIALAGLGILLLLRGVVLRNNLIVPGNVLDWVAVPAAAAVMALALRAGASRASSAPGESWTQHVSKRTLAPWLGALVVVSQQASLLESWRTGDFPWQDWAGILLLLGILRWQRGRTSFCAPHIYSKVLLAASLFTLLVAEWTDINALRHFALGLLLVSASSWRRGWSWPILACGLFVWAFSLPVASAVIALAGYQGTSVAVLRALAQSISLMALVWCCVRYAQTTLTKVFHDDGWQPVKRYAISLFLLLTLFQAAGAFWPVPGEGIGTLSHSSRLLAARSVPFSLGKMHAQSLSLASGQFLFIGHPSSEPVQLQSHRLAFKLTGWTVTRHRFVPHANGQAVELQMSRGTETAVALCWYQNGKRTFTHLLRARHVLWSGWNLNRRELRLMVLFAANPPHPGAVAQTAKSHGWFLNLPGGGKAP